MAALLSQGSSSPPGISRSWGADLGNVIVAARPFMPGDLVLQECPMMCTEENAEQLNSIRTCHQSLHIRTHIHGIVASVDFTQQMLAFLSCPPAVQQKVMLMFCPNAELSRGHHGFVQAVEEYELQLLRLGRSFASIAKRAECALLLPLLAAVIDMNECSRVSVAPILLRWMCNAHALNTRGIGLFEHGSLVTHSCNGNLRCGEYLAQRFDMRIVTDISPCACVCGSRLRCSKFPSYHMLLVQSDRELLSVSKKQVCTDCRVGAACITEAGQYRRSLICVKRCGYKTAIHASRCATLSALEYLCIHWLARYGTDCGSLVMQPL